MRRLSIVLAAASVAAQPPGRSPRNHGPGHRNHPRPSCDAYMQRHHGLADGRFLTRAKGTWHMRDDGSRAYDVAPCRVVRYTAENARRCLKNRHLLFVGDSLTRYTSTSLVHFLERSEWPKRFPADVPRCRDPATDAQREACDSGPNVCAEGSWQREPGGAWPAMLAHIGGGADGSLFNGRMECICARGKAMKTNPKDGSSATVQNYLYRGAAVNVTFITQTGWTGTEQLQGWKSSGCAEKGECRFSVEAHAENIERARAPSGNLIRWSWSWLCFILEEHDVSSPTLQKSSKTVFVSLRSVDAGQSVRLRLGGADYRGARRGTPPALPGRAARGVERPGPDPSLRPRRRRDPRPDDPRDRPPDAAATTRIFLWCIAATPRAKA